MNRKFQELRAILLGLTVFYIMFVLMTCSLHPVCCVWRINDIIMFMDSKEKTKCSNNYTADDTTPSGVHVPIFMVYIICRMSSV